MVYQCELVNVTLYIAVRNGRRSVRDQEEVGIVTLKFRVDVIDCQFIEPEPSSSRRTKRAKQDHTESSTVSGICTKL